MNDNANRKFKCTIMLDGCDDSTEINIDLTGKEIELVKRISELSHAESKYLCMPTMDIYVDEEA